MNIIDAKGKSCPIPVVMAKKEMAGQNEFGIQVDNAIAVENLKKLAQSQGFSAAVTEENGIFTVAMLRTGEPVGPAPEVMSCEIPTAGGSWVVFAGKDVIGAGEEELGHSLIKMFFYTLSQSENRPGAIVFMNSGVRLVTENEQTIEHLKVLEGMGVKLVVCGTCLNFYGLAEKLQCGTVSNMYDIVETMSGASKVITL